jgi:hypothetical protein
MHYSEFKIAFWHPFGPHGQEEPNQIMERKRAEIAVNGWTFWSFQHRPMLDDWQRELLVADRDAVFVFCSEGRGAVDPGRAGTLSRPIDCQTYRFVGENSQWRPMPSGVRIPHPFRPGKNLASAFVVQRVIYPVEPFQRPAVEWFSVRKGPWVQAKVPTRGEYLIRRGGAITMRSVRAVLELRWPYLAFVAADESQASERQDLSGNLR